MSKVDVTLIHFFRRHSSSLARTVIFVALFWFGILKVLDLSPANPLIKLLFDKTIHFMSFHAFLISFGLFEVFIAVLFIKKGAERLALPLLLLHMACVSMPLILLPGMTWQQFAVPTLEGQYIIKNLVIVTCAIVIAANLRPIASTMHNL